MEKMVIKIKMPPGGSELPFKCPDCDRSFRCGKGLGAHKRVHLRNTAGRKRSRGNSQELQIVVHSAAGRNQSEGSSSGLQVVAQPLNNAVNVHACPVCQQRWPSLRSVYGHMRKHRDRTWRGMVPPTQQAAVGNGGGPPLLEGNSSAGEGDKLALVVASDVQAPGWAERTRRHGKAPMEMIPETEMDPTTVGQDLMALAVVEASPKEGLEPKTKKKQKPEDGNAGAPVSVTGGSLAAGSKPLLSRNKQYVCDICLKKHKTYRALGAHRSHHILTFRGHGETYRAPNQHAAGEAGVDKGPQPEPAPATAKAPARAPVPAPEPEPEPARAPAPAPELAPAPEPPASEVGSCSGGEKEKEHRPVVFNFDLNELPPPEEME